MNIHSSGHFFLHMEGGSNVVFIALVSGVVSLKKKKMSFFSGPCLFELHCSSCFLSITTNMVS